MQKSNTGDNHVGEEVWLFALFSVSDLLTAAFALSDWLSYYLMHSYIVSASYVAAIPTEISSAVLCEKLPV